MPPSTAPHNVPTPPSTTITSRTSVKFAVVTSGLAPPCTSRYTAPAAEARNPARTNAPSLYAYGLSPSTPTRRSFSRIACHTWPAREWTAHHPSAHAAASSPSAIQYTLRVLATPASDAGRMPAPSASPSSPPVKPNGFFITRIDRASANASVNHRERNVARAQRHGAEHERQREPDQGR